MKTLFLFSIGPVQDFIATARRTRDLWFGSWVLSEISKASAKALRDSGAELVFPAPDTDLAADSPVNVANKILVILPELGDPHENAMKTAKDAAVKRWLEIATGVLNDGSIPAHLLMLVNRSRFDEHVSDLVETNAAWVPLATDLSNYQAQKQRVDEILGARKNLRNFTPFNGEAGIPKSSLDGTRETVWTDSPKIASRHVRKGEQLCGVSLVKRFGGGKKNFTSTSSIAAIPYLKGLENTDNLKIRELCKELAQDIKNLGYTEATPRPMKLWAHCSGALLFPDRLSEEDCETHRQLTDHYKARLSQLHKKGGQPAPYYAILIGDGDSIGKALAELKTVPAHQRFNACLSQFCQHAREIVENAFGVLVYAGGDDVLALLPLDTFLKCAYDLQKTFGKSLSEFSLTNTPTFSVGIGIGHCSEALQETLNTAREAEKLAKNNGRNSLGIILEKRSGSPLKTVGKWESIKAAMEQLTQMHLDALIPEGLPYELRTLVRQLEMPNSKDSLHIADSLKAEVERIMRRKKTAKGLRAVDKATIDQMFPGLDKPEFFVGNSIEPLVIELIERLLITKELAFARKQAEGHFIRPN